MNEEQNTELHRHHVNQALEYKKDGNAFYVSKNIKKAISKYHRAVIILKGVGNSQSVECVSVGYKNSRLPKDLLYERDQLMSECYNNLAGTF